MATSERYVERARQDELDLLAEEVLKDHGTNVIDPCAILRANGISFSINDYGDAGDAMLEHSRDRFHVYFNSSRCPDPSSARGRFTVAHELGHYFIDEHRRRLEEGVPPHGSSSGFSSRNYVEREADWFAGALLLPRQRFGRLASNVKSLEGLLRLAKQFGVSVQATAIRFAALDINPCAVLLWRDDQVAWRALSPSFFESRFAKTIESAVEVPRDSATGKILRGKASADHIEICGTAASAWFRWVFDESSRNLILLEHAMSLGDYGTMTMLFPDTGQKLAAARRPRIS